MTAARQITLGLVGIGFGEEFLPIYMSHPNVRKVVIVEPDKDRCAVVADRFGIDDRRESLEQLLADDKIDAVHLVTPVAHHAPQALAVLAAGKHCASAVPMATTIDDLRAIIAAQRDSGRNYMMMETIVYGREYLTIRELYRSGRMGNLTFCRGFHIQNLDGFPRYWQGFPPMHYITHALSPLLALLETEVESVTCFGSSLLTPERRGDFDNPFPLEVGLFQLRNSKVIADVTMAFFQTAHRVIEGFSIFGEEMGVEWPDKFGGPLKTYELLPVDTSRGGGGGASSIRGRPCRESLLEPSDFAHLLPEEISRFTRSAEFVRRSDCTVVPVTTWYSGAIAHLAHEFVSSIVEDRLPAIDAVKAAHWTAPGIYAHESALNNGRPTPVEAFRS